ALCGARGKPKQPEDRPRNIAWAIGLLAKFDVRGDAEWARLYGLVFAEARDAGVPLTAEDQLRLCEALASVNACDAEAASAYHHRAAPFPDAVRPAYASLYARAAEQHGLIAQHDLELFALALRDPEAARAFFAQRGWDFGEVEYTFLERSAAAR